MNWNLNFLWPPNCIDELKCFQLVSVYYSLSFVLSSYHYYLDTVPLPFGGHRSSTSLNIPQRDRPFLKVTSTIFAFCVFQLHNAKMIIRFRVSHSELHSAKIFRVLIKSYFLVWFKHFKVWIKHFKVWFKLKSMICRSLKVTLATKLNGIIY